MSIHYKTLVARAGEGKSETGRIRAVAPYGILAGIGFLLILPGQASADHGGLSYGHAEISLGFPNGQVTLGRTWDDEPRHVVVEEVTHRYPRDDRDDEDEDFDRDRDEPAPVIIESHGHCHRHDKVVVIDRYEEPASCDREDVVRRIYVQPPCHRPEVVIYRRPDWDSYEPPRHVYAPSHDVYIAPQGRGPYGHVEERGPGRVEHNSAGPRDLFPEDRGRPMRVRGVQHQVAQAGEYSH